MCERKPAHGADLIAMATDLKRANLKNLLGLEGHHHAGHLHLLPRHNSDATLFLLSKGSQPAIDQARLCLEHEKRLQCLSVRRIFGYAYYATVKRDFLADIISERYGGFGRCGSRLRIARRCEREKSQKNQGPKSWIRSFHFFLPRNLC